MHFVPRFFLPFPPQLYTMLQNPGKTPPTHSDCPVERLLPPELLLLIFEKGLEEEEEEEDKAINSLGETIIEDDGDEEYEDVDSDEESNEGTNAIEVNTKRSQTKILPIQVRVSHVCRRWRNVTVGTPRLWTDLDFTRYSANMLETYIQRSAQCNLSITIDHSPMSASEIRDELEVLELRVRSGVTEDTFTDPRIEEHKDSLLRILDLILPHVKRWQSFYFNTNSDLFLSMMLAGLTNASGGAPELERLELHLFDPAYLAHRIGGDVSILNGNAPKLRVLSYSEICIDLDLLIPPSVRSLTWDSSRLPPQISNLTTLEMSYTPEINNSQQTYEKFAQVLYYARGLQSLSLEDGGPLVPTGVTVEPLFLRSLRELTLKNINEDYVRSILPLFYAPGLVKLVLDFDEDGGDYTNVVAKLVAPMTLPSRPPPDFSNPIYLPELDRNVIPSQARSLVANLADLKLAGLPTSPQVLMEKKLYQACPFLRRLYLNMSFLNHSYAKALLGDRDKGGLPFQMLEEWTVIGLDARSIIAITGYWKYFNLDLKRLRIGKDTKIKDFQMKNLENLVQHVELVEISDDETEVDDSEDDDDDDDDDDDYDEDDSDSDEGDIGHVGDEDDDSDWESISDDEGIVDEWG